MASKFPTEQVKIFTDVTAVLDTRNLVGIPNAIGIIKKYHGNGLTFYRNGAKFCTKGQFDKVQEFYLYVNHQMEQNKPVSIIEGSSIKPSVKEYLEALLNESETTSMRMSLTKGKLQKKNFDLVTFCSVICTDQPMLKCFQSDISTARNFLDEAHKIRVSFRATNNELVEKCCWNLSKKCQDLQTPYVCVKVTGCANYLKSLVQDLVTKYLPEIIIADKGYMYIAGDTSCMKLCKDFIAKFISHQVQIMERFFVTHCTKEENEVVSTSDNLRLQYDTDKKGENYSNFGIDKPQTSISNSQPSTGSADESGSTPMDTDQEYLTADEEHFMREPSIEELHLGPGMLVYLRMFHQDIIKQLEKEYQVFLYENTNKDGVINVTCFKQKITERILSHIGGIIQDIILDITFESIDVNLKDESLQNVVSSYKKKATKQNVLIMESSSQKSITILGPKKNGNNICIEIQSEFDRVKPKSARRKRILVSDSISTANYLDTPSAKDFRSLPALSSNCYDEERMYKHVATGVSVILNNTDITTLHVDAIVNAANEDLQHVGGVALAIATAGGSDIQKECNNFIEKYGKVKVGCAWCVTTAGRMPSKQVIHVVGPMWNDYRSQKYCTEDLKKAFHSVLREADKFASTIAIPAISSGIYAVPPYLVADAACQSIVEYLRIYSWTRIKKIYLVDISSHIIKLYQKQMSHMVEKKIFIEVDNTVSAASVGARPKTFESHMRHTISSVPRSHLSYSDAVTKTSTAALYHGTRSKTDDKLAKVHQSTSQLVKLKKEELDDCCICMCPPTNPKVLDKCKHVFCKDCIDRGFKIKPVCPVCGEIYGQITGDQPSNGKMDVRKDRKISLLGYSDCGAIVIDYSVPSGKQTKDMPNPGQQYSGTNRRAYLPDNQEGNKVLKLLKKAFEARLIFTVGSSRTTGKENTVTWNDIHHKTNIYGGPEKFGYPDSHYLSRVQDELAAKGIK